MRENGGRADISIRFRLANRNNNASTRAQLCSISRSALRDLCVQVAWRRTSRRAAVSGAQPLCAHDAFAAYNKPRSAAHGPLTPNTSGSCKWHGLWPDNVTLCRRRAL